MGSFAMINDKEYLEELNFAELMSIKRSARDRQVDAVYATAPQILEASSARAKAVLRGKSGSIARPQRFSALNDRQIDHTRERSGWLPMLNRIKFNSVRGAPQIEKALHKGRMCHKFRSAKPLPVTRPQNNHCRVASLRTPA